MMKKKYIDGLKFGIGFVRDGQGCDSLLSDLAVILKVVGIWSSFVETYDPV
jgi:hypothetical protein